MSNTVKIMVVSMVMSGAVFAAQHQPKQPSFALAQSQDMSVDGKPALVRVYAPSPQWPHGHCDFMMDAPHLRVAALLGHFSVRHSQVLQKPAALPVFVHQPRYVKCFNPNQDMFF